MSLILSNDVRVTIGGIACATVLDIDIAQNAYREAGTFRISLALGSDPASSEIRILLAQTGPAGPSPIDVTIDVGQALPATGPMAWMTLMVGTADFISLDVETGIVDIEGRDLLARLIDLPLTDNFVNQTSSDIVSRLAAIAGLTASVTPTATIVGQYYEIEHSRSSLNAHTRFGTAFDLVANLAQAEGFDVWMENAVLNFGPAAASATSITIDVSALREGLAGSSPFQGLRFDRRVGSAQSNNVVVRSWNSRQRAAVEQHYPDTPSDGSTDVTFVAPNMTDDMALALAKSLYADMTGHRATVLGRMIGDLTLMPYATIQVVGSDGFDGPYIVQSVNRTINARTGFVQRFVARAQ